MSALKRVLPPSFTVNVQQGGPGDGCDPARVKMQIFLG